MKLKVAIIQASTKRNDLDHNFRVTEKLILRARKKGARIACTPECMMDGYAFDTDEFQLEPVKYCIDPGKSKHYEKLKELARRTRIFIIVGMSLVETGGVYRNAALVFDPHGHEVGRYFKAHSTYENMEATFYRHGDEFPVFTLDVDGLQVRIGLMICYDRQVPEVARILRVNGAEIIFNPAATGNFSRGWNTRLVQTRGYENNCYVVSVNHAAPRINGRSFAVDPSGKVIARCHRKQCVKIVTIDLGKTREGTKILGTRRPSIYSDLVKPSKIKAGTGKGTGNGSGSK
ncbi:MAG: carbon-nitrogen hydrolase family protein [Promethearchaeota archaeon]